MLYCAMFYAIYYAEYSHSIYYRYSYILSEVLTFSLRNSKLLSCTGSTSYLQLSCCISPSQCANSRLWETLEKDVRMSRSLSQKDVKVMSSRTREEQNLIIWTSPIQNLCSCRIRWFFSGLLLPSNGPSPALVVLHIDFSVWVSRKLFKCYLVYVYY